LSSIVHQGDHLWVANDETTSIERLMIAGDQARGHRSFDLTGFFELPVEGELDIEGLDVEGDKMWLLGSHSAVRKRVKDKHNPDQARKALAAVEASPRRQVLAWLSTTAFLDSGGSPNGEQRRPAVFGPVAAAEGACWLYCPFVRQGSCRPAPWRPGGGAVIGVDPFLFCRRGRFPADTSSCARPPG
jgi:Protein of unknown function (DUF3616)